MENRKTPKPGSEEYDVEKTQNLNIPEFNSSTSRRKSGELPSVENLDHQPVEQTDASKDMELPETNLGNERNEDEDENEKLISP